MDIPWWLFVTVLTIWGLIWYMIGFFDGSR